MIKKVFTIDRSEWVADENSTEIVCTLSGAYLQSLFTNDTFFWSYGDVSVCFVLEGHYFFPPEQKVIIDGFTLICVGRKLTAVTIELTCLTGSITKGIVYKLYSALKWLPKAKSRNLSEVNAGVAVTWFWVNSTDLVTEIWYM